jgi:DNA polymerase delta subunit 1
MNNPLLTWSRPPPPPIGASLAFQCLDIDLQERSSGPVADPIIRMFGVTETGNSVCVHVYGARPYFYCDALPDMEPVAASSIWNELLLGRFQNKWCKETLFVLSIEPVQRQSVMGYIPGATTTSLWKITLSADKYISFLRSYLIENGVQTYESNVPFTLRFMIDRGIVGGGWVEVVEEALEARKTVSRCQLEYDVVALAVQAREPTPGRWSSIAPLRVFSFDIECLGANNHFPTPEKDPVILIAACITMEGSTRKRVFLLADSCAPMPGVDELSLHPSETHMLMAFAEFIREVDPDIFTGYNVQNFDFPYIINRATALDVPNSFYEMGRVIGKKTTLKKTTFSSSAYGTRTSTDTICDGRIMMDVIQYMYRNHKMSSYSLNAVSAEFLKQEKEDVHYSMIGTLYRGTDEHRQRLSSYCLKDALLPTLLINKLMIVVNYIEMARVTGVPLSFLFSRGQQIKVLSMLYRKTGKVGIVIPFIKKAIDKKRAREDDKDDHDDDPPTLYDQIMARKEIDDDDDDDDDGTTYEGATVLDPIKGYYDVPIATLDFASLYPSIMQAHNLCYTTWLRTPEEIAAVPEEQRETSPCGHTFVRESLKKGLLPLILDELLGARKRAKIDMKNATTELEKAVMNGRQLALKVSANSVYGFTGAAATGALPCVPISASVTAYGRTMIEATKNFTESHYCIKNGYPADSKVVYGDTDSVMVRFSPSKDMTVAKSMELGLDAAKRITTIFPRPISLEFEKVYYPYLLLSKKRYAGLYWSKTDKWDKLETKGIETVRRDNCKFVRSILSTCLTKILVDQDIPGAVAYTQSQISLLLQGKIDLSLLIISKSLSVEPTAYKNPQPHAALTLKLRKRDPGSAPVVGDRVPYVLIQAAKNAKTWEKAEDPLFAMENGLPIDADYYLHKQLIKPITRLFSSILPHPEHTFLVGPHTSKIVRKAPTLTEGKITGFFTKSVLCLSCKAPTPSPTSLLCPTCEPHKKEWEDKIKADWSVASALLSKAMDTCRTCQGDFHGEVLCANRDCDLFYTRIKYRKDEETLRRTGAGLGITIDDI